MATPNDIAIEDMTGTWSMDKSLSCDTGSMLVLQGISWLVRKAIGLATVTLKLTQVPGTNPSTSNPTVEITVLQSTGTSLGATTDKLYLDWTVLAREDHIFGKTTAQARFVSGTASEGKSRPELEIQTTIEDVNIAKFLRGEIDEDGKPCEGFLVEVPKKDVQGLNGQEGLWTHVVIRSQDSKWTAEQVWGFEIINGERYYVRRTVVSDNKGKHQLGRIAYTFKGRNEN